MKMFILHFFAAFHLHIAHSLPLEVPITSVSQQLFIICRIKSFEKAFLVFLPGFFPPPE